MEKYNRVLNHIIIITTEQGLIWIKQWCDVCQLKIENIASDFLTNEQRRSENTSCM